MTTQQALGGQCRAALSTVACDGFHRIIRAGRIEAAGATEEWAKDKLVGAHQEKQQICAEAAGARGGDARVYFSALASRSSSSRSSAANGAVATELRG